MNNNDKTPKIRIALVCQECGETWRISPNAHDDPQCPKCGSVEWDVILTGDLQIGAKQR